MGVNPSPAPEASPPTRGLATQGRLQLKGHIPSPMLSSTPPLLRGPRRSGESPVPKPASSPSPLRSPKRRATSPAPSAAASPSPRKKTKHAAAAGYAPPSVYSHLPLLPDALLPNLLVLFVGLNPGIQTARTGHAYAHPSNLFWRLLHRGGLTPRRCRPEEDGDMPRLFSLGLTNIVARPSRCGSELSREEMDEGVAALEVKARRCRAEVVCLVGKGIWESVERVWKTREKDGGDGRAGAGRGRNKSKNGGGGKKSKATFAYGWQDHMGRMGAASGEDDGEPYEGARIFVSTSTSGLAAGVSLAEKERIWGELGSYVNRRREERGTAGAEAIAAVGPEGEEASFAVKAERGEAGVVVKAERREADNAVKTESKLTGVRSRFFE